MTTTTITAPADWEYPEVTEGSIFVCSWGYDQTNVDYYRVVRRTKSTIWVQRVQTALVRGAGQPQEYVIATDEPVVGAWVSTDQGTVYDREAPAPITRHRFSKGWGRPSFTVASYAHASLWDGKPEYRTGAMWGR